MILLLDNYDSFTYNLFDCFRRMGAEVLVVRNDAISITEIEHMCPDRIVFSPGPGEPQNAAILMPLIAAMYGPTPMLGICLGYQAIAMHFGAKLIRSAIPMHGKTSEIIHTPDPIFEGIGTDMQVMRYHSLNIDDIGGEITCIAETKDTAEPMAIRHIRLPIYGVQFHPESIGTPQGFTLLENWYRITGL